MTQVDPAVLAELPPDVVAELIARLPPSHEPFSKQGNLSQSPNEPEPENSAHASCEGKANARQPTDAARAGGSKVSADTVSFTFLNVQKPLQVLLAFHLPLKILLLTGNEMKRLISCAAAKAEAAWTCGGCAPGLVRTELCARRIVAG